ncbi:MAG: PAS domain-containing protein, partial [Comamonadaceae bacterium]
MAFGKGLAAARRFQTFDLLATLIAVIRDDGALIFANSALEDALGHSRRTLTGTPFAACFTDASVLHSAIQGARSNDFATLRYEAFLRRSSGEPLPVQVTLAQTDRRGEMVLEMAPQEQQARLDREERLLD